jgi:phage shock protein E
MKRIEELIKDPSVSFVDVRSPLEFSLEHVPGALNIPLEEVPQRIEEIRKLSAPVVLYCRSGNRSGMAVSLLKQAGCTEVYNGGGVYDLLPYLN